MPRPVIAVIGGLSVDKIHLVSELPERGQLVNAEKFDEIGGRVANIAIAAQRASRYRPPNPDGSSPYSDDYTDHYQQHQQRQSHRFYSDEHDENSDYEDPELTVRRRPLDDNASSSFIPEIRVIAAVARKHQEAFTEMLAQNGLATDGLRVFDGEQAEVYSLVERDQGRARQTMSAGVEQLWTPYDFDTPEKLGGGVRPDLVVVTMDLKREVVESIIRTAGEASIEVIVYASPAMHLLAELYPYVTHMILDEGGAGVILGYSRGFVTVNNWANICEQFIEENGVKNVVLKLGPYGAYFKNADTEGYASGYTKIREIADATGSTGAFVGVYALEYLRSKMLSEPWQIDKAAELGNKVCAFCVVDIGCLHATPWKDDLEKFNDSPLFDDLETLRKRLMRRKAKRDTA